VTTVRDADGLGRLRVSATRMEYGLLKIQHTHRRLKWNSVLAHGHADD